MGKLIPKIINAANNIYNEALMLKVHYGVVKHYHMLMKKNKISNTYVDGERDYIEKWKRLYPKVAVEDYRLFSHYIGADINIVPEAISHNIVEAILNPMEHRAYYTDKNMFDKIMPDGFLAPTILRRINGFFFDKDYCSCPEPDLERLLDGYERIVVKPTVDSSSGHGVTIFQRDGKDFTALNGGMKDKILTIPRLIEFFGKNLIVQKCFQQSPFMAHFCDTCVNTIRLCVYRSVSNDEVVIPASIMRLGHKGAYVDNNHAGGVSIGVFPDGRLNTYSTDQYGQRYTKVNGLDFEKEQYVIPNFNKIIDFAKEVGKNLIHCRLSNIDVMIDECGKPHLIEYNLNSMSTWLYQFDCGVAYGQYADEIIDYCAFHLNDAKHVRIEY